MPTHLTLEEELGPKKIRDVRVRYADGSEGTKSVYGVVTLDLKSRMGNFDVLAESPGAEPLIGQTVLEEIDLVVDLRNRCLAPNPLSLDMPRIDVLQRNMKMRKQFTLEYWIDGDWYVGRLKEVPGVFSQGESLDELMDNIRDAYAMMAEEQAVLPFEGIPSHEIEIEV